MPMVVKHKSDIQQESTQTMVAIYKVSQLKNEEQQAAYIIVLFEDQGNSHYL